MNVNIGGGTFQYEGWLNVDRQTGFAITPNTLFPVSDESVDLVYSSHFLEHCDDATVERVLYEAHRMLKPDGALVIKLPDAGQVLERWRDGDEAYFDQWGQKKVWQTWKNLGVPVSIDSKAAMIFCGGWNDAYGDEFGERHPEALGAYHGPVPKMDYAAVRDFEPSPHSLAVRMREEWVRNFGTPHWNHQNAWSSTEFIALLKEHDFADIIEGADQVCQAHPHIPGICFQRHISMYFKCRPLHK